MNARNVKLLTLLFVSFLIFVFSPLPAQAAQNCCVFAGIGGGDRCQPDTTSETCTGIDGIFFGDCNIGICREAGYAPPLPEEAPQPPSAVGADAVRNRLKGTAGAIGIGTPPSPATLAGRLVRAALVILGLIFFTLIIYGGILYLTASGNEERVKKARQIIVRAIIGLLIVIFAGAIIQFVTYYVAQYVTS